MNSKQLTTQIKKGKIFIYPTDTIYGLGCNAEDKKAVEKIKQIKARDKNKPLSIIAPSIDWIKNNCKLSKQDKSNIEKYLPGPYTLILKKKNKNFLNQISKTDSLGIRIPDSDFCFEIQKTGAPFITTSVNFSGQKPANKISDIKKQIKDKTDIIIDAGKLSGKPSTLIIDGKLVRRK